jgi:hypothetical protein
MSDKDFTHGRVSDRLTDLTTNLLRIVRGAGRPALVLEQTARLLEAFNAYRTAHGTWVPDWELGQMLVLPDDFPHEFRTITQGALQLTASHLANQRAQAAAGEREILGGIQALERRNAR